MLQNRATEEALTGRVRQNTPGEEDNPRTVAERVCYRLANKQLAFPGAAIARMIREAGGSHKSRGSRKSLKYIVPAAVLVLDDLCPLFYNDRKTRLVDFEIDSRPVTIPATKGRIMRHRPRFNEWAAPVNLRIIDTVLDEAMVRRLMIEGLQQIGIGDYRPEKGGPFGTSDLVSWSVSSSVPAVEKPGSPRKAA
jgi:hypothetical protein